MEKTFRFNIYWLKIESFIEVWECGLISQRKRVRRRRDEQLEVVGFMNSGYGSLRIFVLMKVLASYKEIALACIAFLLLMYKFKLNEHLRMCLITCKCF